jgi:hypothetical protein
VSRLFLVQIAPVQEIAAHPATLEQLTQLLREHAATPDRPSALAELGFGLPLTRDDRLPQGVVYCRPTGAALSPYIPLPDWITTA